MRREQQRKTQQGRASVVGVCVLLMVAGQAHGQDAQEAASPGTAAAPTARKGTAATAGGAAKSRPPPPSQAAAKPGAASAHQDATGKGTAAKGTTRQGTAGKRQDKVKAQVAQTRRSQTRRAGPLLLAFQGRIDALRVTGVQDASWPAAPWVTPGLRLLPGEKLFVGLGVGAVGVGDDGPSAFSASPLLTYDLLQRGIARLAVAGWINLGRSKAAGADGEFFGGGQVALGLRAALHRHFSIGTEWGWGVLSREPSSGAWAHGLFGTLLCETSLDLRPKISRTSASR
ncbi:MAG: hypothetical protein ACPGUV_04075 [Polyangiales bacterium]